MPGKRKMPTVRDDRLPADDQAARAEPLPCAVGSKVKSRKIDFIVPERVPKGVIVCVEGRKGVGKSSVVARIAADVTGGPRFLDGAPRKLGTVHWYAAEESVRSVCRPKLQAAGCKMDQIRFLGCDAEGNRVRTLRLPNDFWALQNTLVADKSALLVLDPWSACMDEGVSLKDEQQQRAVLEALGTLADATGLTVVLQRHLRKQTSGPAIDQGLGGVAIANYCRSILRCDRNPEGEGFLLSHVANSYGAEAATLAFTLGDGKGPPAVTITGEVAVDAETLAEDQGDGGEKDERADAKTLIQRVVGKCWVLAQTILMEAARAGISPRTLRRAKAAMGVRSRRMQNQTTSYWEWGPPLNGWPKGAKRKGG